MSRHSDLNTPGAAATRRNAPLELLVAVFRDEQTAMHTLKGLNTEPNRFVGIRSAAILRKDKIGRLHIKETADMGSGQGAVIGAVGGAVIGVIAGAGLAAPSAVGALIGGLAASLRSSGFSSERLNRLGKDLKPRASVMVAVVDESSANEVEQNLAEAGADVFTEELDVETVAQLEAGHKVAYNTLVTREGLAVGRNAASDATEGGMLVVDDVGVTASRFMVTEEGFAVRAIDVTGDQPVVKQESYE